MPSVMEHVKRRERLHRAKTSCMLIAGIPLSFLGPAVLATFFWAALTLGARSLRNEYGIGWLELFALMSLITIPLLYRLELRTGGDYFAMTMSDTEVRVPAGMIAIPGPGRDVVAAGALLANPRATSSLFVEFFLFGPRMVIGGLRQAKMARRLRLADLSPVVEIIGILRDAEGGIETSSLMRADRKREDILPSLAYLSFHNWIGVGEGWNKVWLFSEARRTLRPAILG